MHGLELYCTLASHASCPKTPSPPAVIQNSITMWGHMRELRIAVFDGHPPNVQCGMLHPLMWHDLKSVANRGSGFTFLPLRSSGPGTWRRPLADSQLSPRALRSCTSLLCCRHSVRSRRPCFTSGPSTFLLPAQGVSDQQLCKLCRLHDHCS